MTHWKDGEISLAYWKDGEISLAYAKDLKCINLYNWLLNFIHTHTHTPNDKKVYLSGFISSHVLRILFVRTFF